MGVKREGRWNYRVWNKTIGQFSQISPIATNYYDHYPPCRVSADEGVWSSGSLTFQRFHFQPLVFAYWFMWITSYAQKEIRQSMSWCSLTPFGCNTVESRTSEQSSVFVWCSYLQRACGQISERMNEWICDHDSLWGDFKIRILHSGLSIRARVMTSVLQN